MKKNIIYTICIFLVSCVNQQSNTIKNIKARKINIAINKKLIKNPSDLIIINSHEFIIQNSETDYFFEYINTKNGKHFNFGRKGRGPNEMLALTSSSYNKNKHILYCYDVVNRAYYSFDIKKIRQGVKKDIVKREFKIYDKNNMPLAFYPFYNSNFIAEGLYKKGNFGIYNKNGQFLYSFGNEDIKRKENKNKAINLRANLVVHPTKPLFVSTFLCSDILEIYKMNKDSFVLVNKDYEPTFYPTIKVVANAGKFNSTMSNLDDVVGFSSCAVSDEYIFILYSTNKLKELLIKHKYPKIIRVYDWDGNHIANINIDKPLYAGFTVKRIGNKHYIYAFVIDEKSSRLNFVKYEIKL